MRRVRWPGRRPMRTAGSATASSSSARSGSGTRPSCSTATASSPRRCSRRDGALDWDALPSRRRGSGSETPRPCATAPRVAPCWPGSRAVARYTCVTDASDSEQRAVMASLEPHRRRCVDRRRPLRHEPLQLVLSVTSASPLAAPLMLRTRLAPTRLALRARAWATMWLRVRRARCDGCAGCGVALARTHHPTRRARCGNGARTRGTAPSPGSSHTRDAPGRPRHRRTGRRTTGHGRGTGPSSIHACSASYSGIGCSSMRSVERYARGFGSRVIGTVPLSTRSGRCGTLPKPSALCSDDTSPLRRSTP